MAYLIDSDVVIDHLADVPAATILLEHLATEGIAVSIITYMEAYQGMLRSPHPASAGKKFEAFLETVPALTFLLKVLSGAYSCGKRCIERASGSKHGHLT